MTTIEKRLRERMAGDYSTAIVENDGTSYIVLLGTGEMSYGRDGECAYAYDVEDVEDLLAKHDIEIDYSEDFCARLSPCEDRGLAIRCATLGYRLTEGGSCGPVLTDGEYQVARAVMEMCS